MPPKGLHFITFGDPNQMRDDQTISRIRQHAMKDVGVSRRLPNSRRSRRRNLLPGSPQEQNEPRVLPTRNPPIRSCPESPIAGNDSSNHPGDTASATPAPEPSLPSTQFEPSATSPLQYSLPRPPSYEIDPFQSMPVAADNTVYTLVQYYKYHYHENGNWVYETGSLPHEPYLFRLFVEEKASLAFNDRLTMFSLLAATAARMRNRDNVRCLHIQKQMRLSMCNALQLLQKRIEQVSLETAHSATQLMHCITFLASAESYYDNFSAAKAHRSAIATLLHSIGGISAVDNDYTRGQLIAFDVLLSCQTLQPCLIECDYDPGPASADQTLFVWQLSVPLDDCPWGDALLQSHARSVSSSLRSIVRKLVEVQDFRERLKAMPDHPVASQARRWVCHRTAAVRATLLASEPSHRAARALRIALIMFTLLPSHDLTRAWVVKVQARKLRLELETSSTSDWHNCQGVKFWTLLMGYFCARDDADEKNWFFASVLHAWTTQSDLLSHTAGETTADKLVDFQRHFFFHERIQRPLTEQLAHNLIA